MEEWVGAKWHQFITGKARSDFPDAAVRLNEQSRALGIWFRALGGDPGLRLIEARPRDYCSQSARLRKLAGTHTKFALAGRAVDTLYLPPELAVFPDAESNRLLYRWLVMLAAVQVDVSPFHWLHGNQALTQKALARFPGFSASYRHLLAQYQSIRSALSSEDEHVKAREWVLWEALQHPGSIQDLPSASSPPEPVWLWLYPVLTDVPQFVANDDDKDAKQGRARKRRRKTQKKAAEYVDAFDQNKGLMVFRLENLFSWSEFKPVDRAGDDTEEEDAEAVAEDLDMLSLSRERRASSSSIRMDLDLPAAGLDDLRLGQGILLPEWDYRRQTLVPDHCCLQVMIADQAQPAELPSHLSRLARGLKRQFEQLQVQRQWRHRQPEGDELELERWINWKAEHQQSQASEPEQMFKSFSQQGRELSCLVLADLSLSTDAWIDNSQRVIDVIRDSLQVLAEALSGGRDRFALYGFSSRRREHVRFHVLKNFNEAYGAQVRGRLQALKPGYYTRMGAAIRQASKILVNEGSSRKVLLILSDGKPNDLDHYEGRYGVEDTRMALLEARRLGLHPFCVTIDQEAEDYLPYLFGGQGYAIVREPAELTRKLPAFYAALTH